MPFAVGVAAIAVIVNTLGFDELNEGGKRVAHHGVRILVSYSAEYEAVSCELDPFCVLASLKHAIFVFDELCLKVAKPADDAVKPDRER